MGRGEGWKGASQQIGGVEREGDGESMEKLHTGIYLGISRWKGYINSGIQGIFIIVMHTNR